MILRDQLQILKNMSKTDRAIFFRRFAASAPIQSEQQLQDMLLPDQASAGRLHACSAT